MQIQNKYKHLHYLVCLGHGLRKASSDITHDALPDEMQDQLNRLAGAGDAVTSRSGQESKSRRAR